MTTPARPAAPRPATPRLATPLVVGMSLAVVASAAALAWAVWPGRAPAHPYAMPPAAPTPVSRTYESRSYELGPSDVVATASPSPVALPPDSAEQAALAAASLAGSDAEQITADGLAVTSDPAGDAMPTQAPVEAPARVAAPVAFAAPRLVVPVQPVADSLGPPSSAAGAAALQAQAHAQMLAFGFGEDQWGCLDNVITRESGWHVAATNIKSGAYGLPQALPATKMATAGADWQTNPRTQMAWMLSYVQRRYADPCGAWAHELSAGWY